MTVRLFLALCAAAVLASTSAFADDTACLDAASKGQTFQDTHKLLEARAQFRVCAAAACPTVVQSDCASWLASVERALPSVVVLVTDEEGGSVIDGKVTVDGQPFATKFDGRAIPINPGSHAFHFEVPGGVAADQVVVVPEGEQNHRVTAVMKKSAAIPPPSAAPGPPNEPPSRSGPSTWRTVGWVVGGAGVVGLAVGAVFGLSASQDKSSANCDASNACDPGPLHNARSAATAADVGLIAGGVLLAGGAALVLFAPSGDQHGANAIQATPIVGTNSVGVVIGGTW
jgi:hypothetical protein